jgi:hypothetical protein
MVLAVSIAVVAATAMAPTVAAAAESDKGNAVTRAGHTVAEGARKGGHAVAEGARKGGRAVARGARKGGHAVAEGARKGGHAVAEGARATGRWVSRPFRGGDASAHRSSARADSTHRATGAHHR